MSGRVLRLRRISRNVADLTRMVAFYCEALDFRLIGRRRIEDPGLGALLDLPGVRAQVARLCLGAQEIELVAFDPPGRPYPHQGNAADLGFQHLAIVVSDMSRAHARILAHGVAPWVGLPLWIPENDPDSGGFMTVDCRRALEAGLVPRPLVGTIDDTAAWLTTRDNSGAWKVVMSAAKEREILAAARGA